MPLINGWEVIKYVKASANRTGVNVVFEKRNSPRHDGTNIYLPRITVSTTEEQLEDMMSSTDHEVAHDLYSSFKFMKELKIDTMNSVLGFVWNMLEDHRVNSIEADNYEGFRQLWDKTAVRKITKAIKNINKNCSDTKGLLIATCFYWHYKENYSRFPLASESVNDIKYDKDMLDKLGKYSEELAHCTTILDKYEGSKATYTLAKKILEEFKIEEESNEEEQKELNKLLEQLSEALESIHEAEYIKKNTSREEGKPSSLAKSDLSFGSWSINPNVEIKNIFKEGCPEIDESLLGNLLDSAKAEQGFSNQVRRLIQIRSRNKFEYGVKKGKLDSSRISRICMKDAPGFNERIFKQKYVSEVLNAAVSLLVDTSGSMNGTRYFNASKSVLLLNEAIGKALHVPLEIVGYTDCVQEGDPILMCIHKEFDTPRSEIDLAESLRVSQAYMRGNADGESILWSYDRLKQRKEKKKILIVFSDGAPAASRSQEGIYRFTKQVISEIEKENIVDIYGIGIEDESVKELYTHQCTIQDSSEISNKLLQVIEHKLLTNRI